MDEVLDTVVGDTIDSYKRKSELGELTFCKVENDLTTRLKEPSQTQTPYTPHYSLHQLGEGPER
jgi:hypothetical protein